MKCICTLCLPYIEMSIHYANRDLTRNVLGVLNETKDVTIAIRESQARSEPTIRTLSEDVTQLRTDAQNAASTQRCWNRAFMTTAIIGTIFAFVVFVLEVIKR
jgi:hypothetical protein